jgi:hypothetical protein
MRYTIKSDKASTALRTLHEFCLMAAQQAVLAGDAAPRAVVEELRSVTARLFEAGWMKLPRQKVVEQATIHER